jgi:putative hydrolase of the HAD superfamily
MKPGKEIFELALQSNRAEASESLMIGDNHGADVIGAAGVGMDQVWFNPPESHAHKSSTYRINSLRELFQIL